MFNHIEICRVLLFVTAFFAPPDRLWFDRGVAACGQGEYGEAEVHFRRALAARPGFAEAAGNLGGVLCQQGRYAEAVPYLDWAARHLPAAGRARMRHMQGNALIRLNRLPQAAHAFRQALRLRPGYPPAQRNLSYVLTRLGEGRQRKPMIRNLTPAPAKTNPSDKEKPEDASEKPDGRKPDADPDQARSRSADRIASPQEPLQAQDMESLLRQLDAAEKQVRGRPTRAKAEKKGRAEEKDW